MSKSTFYILVLIWIIIAVIILPLALKIAAPYGRHTRKDIGPMIDNRLGWILMELPSLLLVSFFYFLGDAPKSLVTWIFYALFAFHYFNRSLIFPFRIRTKGKKMPVLIMCSAIFFNLVNGSVIGYYLGFVHDGYALSWLYDPRFIAGMGIFILGMGINFHSDGILINLRKPGETGYKIPKGGLFKWVSCPNHFGEIIEWFGYAIMTWAFPIFSFSVWSFANLVPRTLDHHRWYQEKFEDYPKERKAVIPYLL